MNRYKAAKRASILGIVGNLLLCVIKTIIGVITNSQAMIADAINSGSDIFSSVVTFFGNKIASKKADDDHDLGHGKAEYFYALLVSITMFILAYKIFKDSILSLINGEVYTFNIFLIIVCIITILIKLSLYLYTRKVSKKYNNLLIEANSKDHRNDMLLTSLNLISALLGLYGIYYFDSVVGIIIAIWIFISSFSVFKECYDVLMDKAISKEEKQKVLDIVATHKEIVKVQHFNSTPVGYEYQISLTIFVDGNLSTYESHAIADKLENEIIKKVDDIYLAVIHVNPIDINEKKDK